MRIIRSIAFRVLSLAIMSVMIYAIFTSHFFTQAESLDKDDPGESVGMQIGVPDTSEDKNGEGISGGYSEIIDYIKNNIIPSVVAVISALGALYISVLPVINKVKNASECFGSATNDVRQSTFNYAESQKKIDECIKKVEQMSLKCEQEQKTVRRMLEIAFCNSDELVSKGYAKRIAEISNNVNKGGDEKNEGQNQTDNL